MGIRKIDVHAHVLHPALLEELAAGANGLMPVRRSTSGFAVDGYGELDRLLYDLPGRLESLEARDVVLQLVAPPPPLWARPNWATGAEDARRMNRFTRQTVREAGGRLGGLAVLALGEPERVVEELKREIEAGDIQGVALPSCAGPRTLDDPAFAALFDYLATSRLPAFMHSVSSGLGSLLKEYTLNTVLAWPMETAVSVSRLVFSGVLERSPFNLVLSHGGGTLPFLAGRIDLAYLAPQYERNEACRRHITRPPSTYLRQLYYDTVVASPQSLEFLAGWVGTDHVVFGTDFPYEIGDAEGRLSAPALEAMAPQAQQRIYHDTMRGLLDQFRAA